MDPKKNDIPKGRETGSSFLPKGKNAPFSKKEGLRPQLVTLWEKVEPSLRSQRASLGRTLAALWAKIENFIRTIPAKIKTGRTPSSVQQELPGRSEEEIDDLTERLEQLAAENRDLANRYLELEEENKNLADLAAVSHQLHLSLDFNDILRILTEAVINLLGAEAFAVMIVDDNGEELVTVITEGLEKENIPRISLGKEPGVKIANADKTYSAEDWNRPGTIDGPLMVIPLRIKDLFLGAVIITSFLEPGDSPQKISLQIADLLAGHAAAAILSSKLYLDSERKLSTLQGFLDLLTE